MPVKRTASAPAGAPAPKRSKPTVTLQTPVEGDGKAKPKNKDKVPLSIIKGSEVGAPPDVESRERNGKVTIKRPSDEAIAKTVHAKTPQPEDHPSEEEPISSQEWEDHYVNEAKEASESSGEEEEEDGYSSSEDESEDEEDEEESSDEDVPEEMEPVYSMEFPCNVLLPARRFGGKTNVLELILQERGDEFDQIFIIGRSSATKDKLKQYGRGASDNTDLYHMTDLNEDFLKTLLTEQKKKKHNTLLVFDDATGMKFNLNASPEFEEMCSSGRNDNLSCLFGVQTYKKCPAILRDNSEYRFLGLNYQRAAEQIAGEYGNARTSSKQLREIMREIDLNNRDDYKSFYFMDGKTNDQYVWAPPLAS